MMTLGNPLNEGSKFAATGVTAVGIPVLALEYFLTEKPNALAKTVEPLVSLHTSTQLESSATEPKLLFRQVFDPLVRDDDERS